MSLQLRISGANVRLFLSILTCVSRLGDAVYLVALADGIELNTVTSSRNGFMAVRVHRRFFDLFEFTAAPGDDAKRAEEATAISSSASPPSAGLSELYLCLLTKTLTATVLRLHNNGNVQSIDLQYGGAATTTAEDDAAGNEREDDTFDRWNSDGGRHRRNDADVVRWYCTCARNMTKAFHIRLADGNPISVAVDAARYHFEVCGEARTFGSLLASLPSSANQCTLLLLESRGLELSSVQPQPSGPCASSTASPASAKRGKSSAGAAETAADRSATVVTAFEKSFTFFRYFMPVPTVVRAAHHSNNGGDSGGGSAPSRLSQPREDSCAGREVGPTPSPPWSPTPPQQRQTATESAISATPPSQLGIPATTTIRYMSLPGKTFDVKPFKNAAWLAEQLGLQLRLVVGEEGVPLMIASVTSEEVQERMQSDTAATAPHGNDEGGVIARVSRGGHRPVLSVLNMASPAVVVPAFVSFTLHIAAQDTTPIPRTRISGTGDGLEGAVAADTTIATALSSAAHSPRTSAHLSRLSASGRHGASPIQVHQTPAVGPAEDEAWEELPSGGSRGSAECSGRSHVAASFASATDTATHRAAGAELQKCPSRRASLSTADSIGPTPSSSVMLSERILVMTGGDTPLQGSEGGAQGLTGAPRAAASAAVEEATKMWDGSDAPPLTYTPAALDSLYPLDFEALVRSSTAVTVPGDDGNGEEAEEEEDPQDVELRAFLASCVASMSLQPQRELTEGEREESAGR